MGGGVADDTGRGARGKGQKRRAAEEADSDKENGHSHSTRAKVAKAQQAEKGASMGVRRPLQPVLNRAR